MDEEDYIAKVRGDIVELRENRGYEALESAIMRLEHVLMTESDSVSIALLKNNISRAITELMVTRYVFTELERFKENK